MVPLPTETLSIALVTAPTSAVAESIAQRVVSEGLAPCVNIVPGITSVYRWEGRVCREGEVLMVIKFREGDRQALESALLAAHPYDVPEFVVLAPSYVNSNYLSWALAAAKAYSAPDNESSS